MPTADASRPSKARKFLAFIWQNLTWYERITHAAALSRLFLIGSKGLFCAWLDLILVIVWAVGFAFMTRNLIRANRKRRVLVKRIKASEQTMAFYAKEVFALLFERQEAERRYAPSWEIDLIDVKLDEINRRMTAEVNRIEAVIK